MRSSRLSVPLAVLLLVAAFAAPASAQPAPLSPADLGKLIEALRGEPERPLKVRLQAALIMGRVAGAEAVPALVECLDEDLDYPVRAACALSLGNVGDVRGVEALFARLDDEDELVRDEARRSLLKLARPEALPYMYAAREQGSTRMRLALVEVLSQIGGAEPGALLTEMLGDRDESVRQKAAASLRAMDPATTNRLLMRCLDNPNYRVKAHAARMLGESRFAEAIPRLAEIAGSPLEPIEVQSAARAALRSLGPLLDVAGLTATAKNTELDRGQRNRALVVLSALGGPDALRACLDVLADSDESMRGSAAQALAEMGNPRALPALREAEARSENGRIAKVIAISIHKLERAGAP